MHYYVSHPVSGVSRLIENLLIFGKNSDNLIVKATCHIGASLLGVTLFPAVLGAELILRQLPKTLKIYYYRDEDSGKFQRNLNKVYSLAIGILASPLALRSADRVSSFFLKDDTKEPAVRPFGAELLYGKPVEQIYYPENVAELQRLINQGNKVTIVGAGMSQGTQAVPVEKNHLVINMRLFNKIELGKDSVEVEAGATWKEVQRALDQAGKSLSVKPIFNDFSIGGSIAANIHGCVHDQGALASVVESLTVVNAKGELIEVSSGEKELFGCFFGTFGWFGVIVSAKINYVKNEVLIETREEIALEVFDETYKQKIRGKKIPLFEGRVKLTTDKVTMVRCEYAPEGAMPPKNIPGRMTNLIHHLFRSSSQADAERTVYRNEALCQSLRGFKWLRHSHLHARWYQEYFIKPEELTAFMHYLRNELQNFSLVALSIRALPKDEVSLLPYAERMRYAVMLSFDQLKTNAAIEKTRQSIKKITQHLAETDNRYSMAYTPFSTVDQFEACYGKENVARLRAMKEKYDPAHLFENVHTAAYFEKQPEGVL